MKRELTPNVIGAAIRAFRATNCPACEGKKRHRTDPFCIVCLELLPHDLQLLVVLRNEFIDAFRPAMEHLRLMQTEPRKSDSMIDRIRAEGESAEAFTLKSMDH